MTTRITPRILPVDLLRFLQAFLHEFLKEFFRILLNLSPSFIKDFFCMSFLEFSLVTSSKFFVEIISKTPTTFSSGMSFERFPEFPLGNVYRNSTRNTSEIFPRMSSEYWSDILFEFLKWCFQLFQGQSQEFLPQESLLFFFSIFSQGTTVGDPHGISVRETYPRVFPGLSSIISPEIPTRTLQCISMEISLEIPPQFFL